MKVIEIKSDNLKFYKTELIKLLDYFLDVLDVQQYRTQNEKETILDHMINENKATHIMAISNNEKQLVGVTYFNVGSGYSSGGDYLWMNGICINHDCQNQGFGMALLNYVIDWAKKKDINHFISSRDPDNSISEKLFNRAGFVQSQNIWIKKVI